MFAPCMTWLLLSADLAAVSKNGQGAAWHRRLLLPSWTAGAAATGMITDPRPDAASDRPEKRLRVRTASRGETGVLTRPPAWAVNETPAGVLVAMHRGHASTTSLHYASETVPHIDLVKAGHTHVEFLVQLDPKETAKARARAVKAEAKAAQVAKETRGMKKMSAFFTKPRPAAKAAA